MAQGHLHKTFFGAIVVVGLAAVCAGALADADRMAPAQRAIPAMARVPALAPCNDAVEKR